MFAIHMTIFRKHSQEVRLFTQFYLSTLKFGHPHFGDKMSVEKFILDFFVGMGYVFVNI